MSDDEDEIREVVSFPDLDSAIAAALADCPDGDIVVVHMPDCEADEDGEGCDCEPLELRAGAKA